MKRFSYIITKIDYELNEPGTKTHVAGVVDLNKFDSLSIQILITANTKFLSHSTKLPIITLTLSRGFLSKVNSQQAFLFQLFVSHSLCILFLIKISKFYRSILDTILLLQPGSNYLISSLFSAIRLINPAYLNRILQLAKQRLISINKICLKFSFQASSKPRCHGVFLTNVTVLPAEG